MASQTRPRIIERKTRLDGSFSDFSCDALLVEPGRRAVLRYVSDRTWTIAGTDVTVRPGTVTVGHFWVDRPYNVYQWLADGRTLAYYCNVATATTVTADVVAYLDLTVDVLVRPSGQTMILDEDELPDDLEPAHRRTIALALEALADPRRLVREIEAESAAALRA